MTNKLVVILTLLTYQKLAAQKSLGLEQYWCSGQTASAAPVTKLWYDVPGHAYVEVRYNYDAEKTAGISVGRTFSGPSAANVHWTCTPTIGVMSGSVTAAAAGMNFELSLGRLRASTTVQVAVSYTGNIHGLSYSWSELGLRLSPNIFAGAALQQQPGPDGRWNPGMILEYTIGPWTLPLYLFDPFSKNACLLAGVSREWTLHNRITNLKPPIE